MRSKLNKFNLRRKLQILCMFEDLCSLVNVSVQLIDWRSIACNFFNINSFFFFCNKPEQNKYCLKFNWCVKNLLMYRWSSMIKKMILRTCLKYLWKQCVLFTLWKTIIERTLGQLLIWFRFCSHDTESQLAVGECYQYRRRVGGSQIGQLKRVFYKL